MSSPSTPPRPGSPPGSRCSPPRSRSRSSATTGSAPHCSSCSASPPSPAPCPRAISTTSSPCSIERSLPDDPAPRSPAVPRRRSRRSRASGTRRCLRPPRRAPRPRHHRGIEPRLGRSRCRAPAPLAVRSHLFPHPPPPPPSPAPGPPPPARPPPEASPLPSEEPEFALLRLWLFETTAESTGDRPLMLKLSRQVVEAAAVKYRLSPKRTDDLATAVSAVLERLGEQLTAPQEREV